MTGLLVLAMIGCVATGMLLAHGGKGNVRVHGILAGILVLCAVVHAVGNLLG